MKKFFFVFPVTVIVCMVFIGCTKWTNCSEEAKHNYGRPQRQPSLYGSEYLTLDNFTNHYWEIVDGDNLRMKGYLYQAKIEQNRYYLYLYPSPMEEAPTAKYFRPTPDYLYDDKQKILISPKEGIRDIYDGTATSSIPFLTEECYDTLKYKMCKIEGIIHFTHLKGDDFACREQCYLYVPNLGEQINDNTK